uniref:Uncharacterized protein n=1 Tax=Ixodes scapularis TaxID=6945 RepID=A0A4D5RGC2_IXOSC
MSALFAQVCSIVIAIQTFVRLQSHSLQCEGSIRLRTLMSVSRVGFVAETVLIRDKHIFTFRSFRMCQRMVLAIHTTTTLAKYCVLISLPRGALCKLCILYVHEPN